MGHISFLIHACIKTNLKQKCIFLIYVMDGWTDGIFYPDIMYIWTMGMT